MMKPQKTYKQIKDELDELINWFESSDIDIELAIEKYKQAGVLIAELEKQLAESELAIKKPAKKS